MKFYLGILLGAVVLFFWGFAMWSAVFPRLELVKSLPNEEVVLKAIAESNMTSGLYQYPNMESPEEKWKKGPVVMLQMTPGQEMMPKEIFIQGFLHMLLSAAILATLARCMLSWASFCARYSFIIAVGIFAAVWIDFSRAIWMNTPWPMQLFEAAYNIGAWILAGVPLAWGTQGDPK